MTRLSTPAIALLVEDEALVAMVAEEQLTDLGFTVRSAANGADALFLNAATKGPSVDLALVDVGLPDIRGDELAQKLQAATPGLRVVIASGYDPVALKRGFANDVNVLVISKPYTEDDLAQALRSLGFAIG